MPTMSVILPTTLWHGTSVLNAALIIQENHLRQWAWDGLGAGVSCASELDSAEYFAVRTDAENAARRAFHREHGPDADFNYDSGKAENAYPFLRGAVLELDATLLAEEFRLKRVNYTGDWDDEVEFRVMGAAGVPDIGRFVTGITFSEENLAWWMEECRDEPETLDALRGLGGFSARFGCHPVGFPAP